jgi:glutamate 5-kinase
MKIWPTENVILTPEAHFKTLLDFNVIPIINENDTVVTEEIRFGDNDTLGALVANLIEADTLSDTDRSARPVFCRSSQRPRCNLY